MNERSKKNECKKKMEEKEKTKEKKKNRMKEKEKLKRKIERQKVGRGVSGKELQGDPQSWKTSDDLT